MSEWQPANYTEAAKSSSASSAAAPLWIDFQGLLARQPFQCRHDSTNMQVLCLLHSPNTAETWIGLASVQIPEIAYCTEGQPRSTWNLGLGEDRQRLVRVRRLRCGADDEAVQVAELVEVRGGVGARRAGVPGAANGGQSLDRGRGETKVSKRPVEERGVRGTCCSGCRCSQRAIHLLNDP